MLDKALSLLVVVVAAVLAVTGQKLMEAITLQTNVRSGYIAATAALMDAQAAEARATAKLMTTSRSYGGGSGRPN